MQPQNPSHKPLPQNTPPKSALPDPLAVVVAPDAKLSARQLLLRRLTSALIFIALLGLFLLWLPEPSRRLLVRSLIDNQFLVILLILFALVALSLLWSRGQVLDLWLFQRMNIQRAPSVSLDRLMWVFTQIGSVPMVALVAVVSYGLGDRPFAIGFTSGSLTLMLTVTILKAITDRARPFNALLETKVVGYREHGPSFPSGHTTQTFFMVTLMTLRFPVPLIVTMALYSIAVLVGVTRVYLGVHYPRDVMAGAVLGIIWAIMGLLVAPYL